MQSEKVNMLEELSDTSPNPHISDKLPKDRPTNASHEKFDYIEERKEETKRRGTTRKSLMNDVN